MQSHPHKPTTHFTGSKDQQKYHQGLRSMLNPTDHGMDKQQELPQEKAQEQHSKSPWNLLSKDTQRKKQQQQTRKGSSGSFSDEDLAALPVEKQFETDYDTTGHLVPDTLHFGKDQDMVGASKDEFHEM